MVEVVVALGVLVVPVVVLVVIVPLVVLGVAVIGGGCERVGGWRWRCLCQHVEGMFSKYVTHIFYTYAFMYASTNLCVDMQ